MSFIGHTDFTFFLAKFSETNVLLPKYSPIHVTADSDCWMFCFEVIPHESNSTLKVDTDDSGHGHVSNVEHKD